MIAMVANLDNLIVYVIASSTKLELSHVNLEMIFLIRWLLCK